MRTGQAQLQILCRPMVAQGGGHQFEILLAFYFRTSKAYGSLTSK